MTIGYIEGVMGESIAVRILSLPDSEGKVRVERANGGTYYGQSTWQERYAEIQDIHETAEEMQTEAVGAVERA